MKTEGIPYREGEAAPSDEHVLVQVMDEDGNKGEMMWVLSDQIQQAPLKHEDVESLLPMMRWQWRHLQKQIDWVPSFEQWELGFMRDRNPELEVSYWLRATYAYLEYLHRNPKANKKSVFLVIVGLMTGQERKTKPKSMLQDIKDLIEFAWEDIFEVDNYTSDGRLKSGPKYLR